LQLGEKKELEHYKTHDCGRPEACRNKIQKNPFLIGVNSKRFAFPQMELIPSYLRYKPDAHLILGCHADPRGSEEYNKALTQRRVERTKNFLVEHGVSGGHFETRSFGKEDQLTADQIKELIAQNPDLSPADRQQMPKNLQVLVLANNRRVDVTLSTTGQQSTRLHPFNAKDYLALINFKAEKKSHPSRNRPEGNGATKLTVDRALALLASTRRAWTRPRLLSRVGCHLSQITRSS
jgi:hypothetical protein